MNKFVIGSGGSAFSDGGLGAIQALGVFEFYDDFGRTLPNLSMAEADMISDIKLMDPEFIRAIEIVMPCDVQNPMLGDRGAARVYGPQKGATPEQASLLDAQIGRLVRLFINAIHKDRAKAEIIFQRVANFPGSGASGALVGGFLALLSETGKTNVLSGMEFVAGFLGLYEKIRTSDLIITGEGSFDTQTLEGKAVARIIEICKQHGKPVVVVCGINRIQDDQLCQAFGDIKVIDFTSRFGLTASR